MTLLRPWFYDWGPLGSAGYLRYDFNSKRCLHTVVHTWHNQRCHCCVFCHWCHTKLFTILLGLSPGPCVYKVTIWPSVMFKLQSQVICNFQLSETFRCRERHYFLKHYLIRHVDEDASRNRGRRPVQPHTGSAWACLFLPHVLWWY